MKMMKKFIPVMLWTIALTTLLWSCSEDGTEIPSPIDETTEVRTSFVANSSAALDQLRSTGLAGPIGAMFGNRVGSNNGRITHTPTSMMRARTHNDSTDVNYCFSETWEEDGQGNYRFVLDFGDGCDYYGEYMYGKMEEVGSFTDSSYAALVTYTNFGGSDREGGADWWVDGTYSYVGTWSEKENHEGDGEDDDEGEEEDDDEGEEEDDDEGEEEDDDEEEEYWDYYETSYQFEANLTQTYIEYIGAPEDSVTTGEEVYIIDYVANGSEEMNESGYTVLSRTENVSANTGESYTSSVDTPLFLDFSCEDEDVWVFVSGVESGTYEYEGEAGTYSIDFGDGTCDNIITITENGVSEEVDLGEEWEEWEDDCGDDHEEENDDD